MPQVLEAPAVQRKANVNAVAMRWFYPVTAILLLILVVTGFQHFYLQGRAYPGRPITPPIRGVVISHGLAMSLWLILFAIQPLLVAVGSRRIHMTLGKVGALIALGILALGLYLSVLSARVTPPFVQLWGLAPKSFMVVPVFSVGMFAIGVAIGIWQRKRPEIHRPMMFLGTLSAAGAGISRIDAINNLYVGTVLETIWGPFFSSLVLGAILLALKSLIARKLDKWFAIGLTALTAAFALAMLLGRTGAWEHIASLVV